MDDQTNDSRIEIVKEDYVQVSESRIKNTIKEYKKGQVFNGVLSTSFACVVSFFIAYVSCSFDNSVWTWVFLVLAILFTLIFAIFGIISLVRKKIGHGTEKWFLEEIKNKHPVKTKTKRPVNSKLVFNLVNFILIIGFPLTVLLIVLGINGWNIAGKEWAPIFWVVWIIGTVLSLVFGTYINAYFAYLFFGFEDGFPNELLQ